MTFSYRLTISYLKYVIWSSITYIILVTKLKDIQYQKFGSWILNPIHFTNKFCITCVTNFFIFDVLKLLHSKFVQGLDYTYAGCYGGYKSTRFFRYFYTNSSLNMSPFVCMRHCQTRLSSQQFGITVSTYNFKYNLLKR